MHGRDAALLPTLRRRRWTRPAAVTLAVLTVLEVATFIEVVRTIGAVWAVLLLVLCSTAGAWLLRRAIARNRDRLRARADQDQPLGAAFSDTVVGLFGAALLALPGFFTAVLGLVLLLPPSRLFIRRLVERSAEQQDGEPAVDDLFGPRRVRVRTGKAADVHSPRRELGDAVEGEVVSSSGTA
ncbi:FxsA family protein [Actinoplanes sp. M2I2]|uniref:FxsA family protein n=1 Tax=Actinoplanes sp. M2I2 TaxID=1734444 RepID=UPI002021F6E4|nr:FxsA family protein [Actinoplanes sp. M2I2]